MIQHEKLENPPSQAVSAPETPSALSPSSLSFASIRTLALPQLLVLLDEVRSALPATSLAEMNLEEECVLLFLRSKELMNEVLTNDEIAANQKAQVANSCAANLQQLVKMQLSLFTSERVKAIENALTRVMKTLPAEVQEQFFNEYARTYASLASSTAPQPEAE